jgi:hypothetical protein
VEKARLRRAHRLSRASFLNGGHASAFARLSYGGQVAWPTRRLAPPYGVPPQIPIQFSKSQDANQLSRRAIAPELLCEPPPDNRARRHQHPLSETPPTRFSALTAPAVDGITREHSALEETLVCDAVAP